MSFNNKKQPKKVVGKIGYCNNKTLGMKDKNGQYIKGGHYVYIREHNGGKCNVNVITSIEDKNGFYQKTKIDKVKRGYLYPIPKNDANFSQWSAVNLDGNIKNIPLSDIDKIGVKSFKRRHKFFIGKFTKK